MPSFVGLSHLCAAFVLNPPRAPPQKSHTEMDMSAQWLLKMSQIEREQFLSAETNVDSVTIRS